MAILEADCTALICIIAHVWRAILFTRLNTRPDAIAVICRFQCKSCTKLLSANGISIPVSADTSSVASTVESTRIFLCAVTLRVGAVAGILAVPGTVANPAQAALKFGVSVIVVVNASTFFAVGIAGRASAVTCCVAADTINAEAGLTLVALSTQLAVDSFGLARVVRKFKGIAPVAGDAVNVVVTVGAAIQFGVIALIRSTVNITTIVTSTQPVAGIIQMSEVLGAELSHADRVFRIKSAGTGTIALSVLSANRDAFICTIVFHIRAIVEVDTSAFAVASLAEGAIGARILLRLNETTGTGIFTGRVRSAGRASLGTLCGAAIAIHAEVAFTLFCFTASFAIYLLLDALLITVAVVTCIAIIVGFAEGPTGTGTVITDVRLARLGSIVGTTSGRIAGIGENKKVLFTTLRHTNGSVAPVRASACAITGAVQSAGCLL